MFSIRTAVATDSSALAHLAAKVFAATYGAVIPSEILAQHLRLYYADSALQSQLAEPTIRYFVACHGEQLVGLCKLEESPIHPSVTLKQPIELAKLYIDGEFQGRRIANGLLQSALDFARSQNKDGLWLCVWKQNPRALAFYHKAGFQTVGSTIIDVDGIAFDDAVMQVTL